MNNLRSKSEIANHGFPILIYIISYLLEPEQFKHKDKLHFMVEDLSKKISDKGRVKVISKEFPLTISINSYICKINKIDDENSRTYMISVFSNKKDLEKKSTHFDLTKLSPKIHQFFDAFPKNPISIFMVMTGYSYRLEDSFAEIKKCSYLLNKPVTSIGLIKNYVLATLKEGIEETNGHLRRSFLLFSFENMVDKAAVELNSLIEDMTRYASITGRLNKLFRDRSVIFRHVETSEKNTQERIQDILGNIRRPPEQVKPTNLRSMLTEVSGIYSRLTTITSSIRRDHVTARGFLHRMKEIFNLWDEKHVANYPTNSSIEIGRFEGMVNSFSDNVDRLQALRIQLDTVLDTIRTYVGIQQQNVSVDEQRDTKKLLARMVSLQEVLHKLEILIVAFYITEMGRLVFEAIAHDIVNILTVAFIPVALLLAIGIRKLLHGQG